MTGIFLLQSNDELIEMTEQGYDSENFLQELLAKYPNLLVGNQIDPENPRRWLLISREMPIPSDGAGKDRWSIDHLFLDQDGVPTLVETKRSSDTRLRREVIGQMLDYAANAVVFLPVETIRARFEQTSKSPEEDLLALLGPNFDPESFWQLVKTNLQAGKIRMLFIADEIPSELQQIIEFLNSQMDPAEVLAIEIKQFTGKSVRSLVPRVLGQTANGLQKKHAARSANQWTEENFFAVLSKRTSSGAKVAKKILDWTNSQKIRIWWGTGKKDGSFFSMIDHEGQPHWLIAVWTYGRVEIQFQMMEKQPPFSDEKQRLEFLAMLNAIPGVSIAPSSITIRPSIPLTVFEQETSLESFLKALDWAVAQIREM